MSLKTARLPLPGLHSLASHDIRCSPPRYLSTSTRSTYPPSLSHAPRSARPFLQSIRLRPTCLLFLLGFLLQGCGPTEISFAAKHLSDSTGEKPITETVSYQQKPELDNSKGQAPLQVQLEFRRAYRYQIRMQMNSEQPSEKSVREKIVELYKLPPNAPEDTEQKAQCPIAIVIPEGQKAQIAIEWTERFAEGIINEGKQAEGKRLGTYKVFMGYVEPCSLVKQDNVK